MRLTEDVSGAGERNFVRHDKHRPRRGCSSRAELGVNPTTQIRQAKRIAESLGATVYDVEYGSRHIVLRVKSSRTGQHLGALRLSMGHGSDQRKLRQVRSDIRGLIRGTNRIGMMTGVRA